MFKNYKFEVENQNRKKIKFLRSNRGDEYFSMKFSSFCEENGIIHQTSAPYTPPNKMVWQKERKNRTLVDTLNCMLVNSKLPTSLYGKAFSVLIIYIIEFLLEI
jgi:hypothetical protein